MLGQGKDASFYYDGTNMIINPKEQGSGVLLVNGSLNVSSEGNLTVKDTVDTENLIIRSPPAECPIDTYITFYNGSNSVCVQAYGIGDAVNFTFGNFSDDVFVSGNINTTGNITAENVFLPQFIFSHTNVTILVNGANLWTNVSFDQELTLIKQGIAHTFDDGTNQTFTINAEGIYDISYNYDLIDISPSASEIDIAGRVTFRDGTEINGSVFESDITKQGVETELSHEFLAELKKGDELIFQFIAEDADVEMSTHGTFGIHPESASVVIKKHANIPKG